MIVPTLCVGMPRRTLRVRFWDAERPGLRSHAEHGNDQDQTLSSRNSRSQELITRLKFSCSARLTAT